MRRRIEYIVVAVLVLGAAALGAGAALYFAYPVQVGAVAGAVRSEVLSLNEPPSTVRTEVNPAYKAAAPQPPAPTAHSTAADDWPSYNKTLTTERYSELGQINACPRRGARDREPDLFQEIDILPGRNDAAHTRWSADT